MEPLDQELLREMGLTEPTRTTDYIDVRGVWPVYHNGMVAKVLEWESRDITLPEARALASA